jgi:hypothetical protein
LLGRQALISPEDHPSPQNGEDAHAVKPLLDERLGEDSHGLLLSLFGDGSPQKVGQPTADAIIVDPHGTTSDHVEHEAIL